MTRPTEHPTPHLAPLPAADLEVLEFARLRWKYAGAKETAIRDRFGITLTRYAQRLNAIIDKPAAELYDSRLVRQLREKRETARAVRTAGTRAVTVR